MFQEPGVKTEKDRSRLIMIVSAVAVLLVIGLVILVGSRKPAEPVRVEMAGAGTAEFDSYSQSLQITDFEPFVGERLNARYARLNFRVRNTGEKTLTGLQVRAAAVGFNNEILKEKIVTLVPGRQDALAPNGVIAVEIFLEPIPDPATIMDINATVAGVKLQ